MKTFLIIENNEIVNAILAEKEEDVIQSVGENFIESINGKPWIGWKLYEDGSWRSQSPFPSWVDWDEDILEWTAPVPRPSFPANWDEEIQEWVAIPPPYPSWIIKQNQWIAPIPYPEDSLLYAWDEDTLSWILVD